MAESSSVVTKAIIAMVSVRGRTREEIDVYGYAPHKIDQCLRLLVRHRKLAQVEVMRGTPQPRVVIEYRLTERVRFCRMCERAAIWLSPIGLCQSCHVPDATEQGRISSTCIVCCDLPHRRGENRHGDVVRQDCPFCGEPREEEPPLRLEDFTRNQTGMLAGVADLVGHVSGAFRGDATVGR